MPQTRAVRLEWVGQDLRFTGAGTDPASPPITIDGDSAEGPSPMLTLLLAAAGCSAADVVSILRKMRVGLSRCSVEVAGVRRDEEPRRYVELRFRYTLAGTDLDAGKAERAVDLSLSKYCSVVHSLAPDTVVRHEIVVAAP